MVAKKSQGKKTNKTKQGKITRLKRTGKNQNTQEIATVTVMLIHFRNSTKSLTKKVRSKAIS